LNLKTRKESIIEFIKEKKRIIDLIDMELKSLNDTDEESINIPELDVICQIIHNEVYFYDIIY